MYKPFCWFEIWLFLSASGDVYVTKKKYFIIINTISILRAHINACVEGTTLYFIFAIYKIIARYISYTKHLCEKINVQQIKNTRKKLIQVIWNFVIGKEWSEFCRAVGYEINKISSRHIHKEKINKKICRVLNKIKF